MTSDLALKGFKSAAAQVYSYSGANLNAIVRQPDQAASATGNHRHISGKFDDTFGNSSTHWLNLAK